MNGTGIWIGWALAAAAVVVGYLQYGWRGLVLALSITVFWLLLQFSRAMRTMRLAAANPVGHVDSAVMLQARLKPGMRMLDLLALTRSLGVRVGDDPERWRWTDPGEVAVEVTFARGRTTAWQLIRPGDPGTS